MSSNEGFYIIKGICSGMMAIFVVFYYFRFSVKFYFAFSFEIV